MMVFNDYKHHTPIQIRFGDIDRLNHVNNACYLSYFETARLNYFRDVVKDEINWSDNGFVIARTEIDYLRPIYLRDEIHCFTKLLRIGNKSMTMGSTLVINEGTEMQECARSLIVLTAMNYQTKKSMLVPASWRKMIAAFEGTDANYGI